jgi:hypothetical protein
MKNNYNKKANVTNDMRGEESDDYGTFEIYKNGGNIEVKVVNSDKQYNEKQYDWILGDKDKDSVANADDVKPLDKNIKERIDEPTITTGIKNLISLKKSLDSTMYSFIEDLKNVAPNNSKIYARTKTPYSVLDKLIKKRLSTITDLIGTTIVTNDKKELDAIKNYVESGKIGKVVEMEDMYEKPKQGYRAYHFLIERNGMTIELQVKTKRQKALNELSHEPYKLGKLNSTVNLKMTELANRADEGDKNAIKEYNDFMNQPNVEKLFYADGQMMAKGGTLTKSQLKHFKEWMEDGNVSKNNDGTYSTQDAQFSNKLKDFNELKKYFKREFAIDEYADGGGVDDIQKKIEYAKTLKVGDEFSYKDSGRLRPTKDIVYYIFNDDPINFIGIKERDEDDRSYVEKVQTIKIFVPEKDSDTKMANGGSVSKRGGNFNVGDKVMVDDSGYIKSFQGFDLSKPATILTKNKVKTSQGIKYSYSIELADGRKPFNNAMENKLTLADTYYAKGGEVNNPSKKEMLNYLNMYFDNYSELRTIAVEEDNILTRKMLNSLDDELLELAYEDAKYEIKADTQYADGGKMAKGGGVKKRIVVVWDEGYGKVINDLYNQWNNVKTQVQYDKWVSKVKETKFGTYGNIPFEEVLEKFDFDNAPINSFHLKTFKVELKNALNKYEDGGLMDSQQGIDLFEDYENIPANVQSILDNHEDAFMDGDYKELQKALTQLKKIGYTFEYDLDGQAYDLRPIGTKGKSEMEEYEEGTEAFKQGGNVDSSVTKLNKLGIRTSDEFGDEFRDFLDDLEEKNDGEYIGYRLDLPNNELTLIQEKATKTVSILDYSEFPKDKTWRIEKHSIIHYKEGGSMTNKNQTTMTQEHIDKFVRGANSTDETAREISTRKLKEAGLDKNGKPLESKLSKPKTSKKVKVTPMEKLDKETKTSMEDYFDKSKEDAEDDEGKTLISYDEFNKMWNTMPHDTFLFWVGWDTYSYNEFEVMGDGDFKKGIEKFYKDYKVLVDFQIDGSDKTYRIDIRKSSKPTTSEKKAKATNTSKAPMTDSKETEDEYCKRIIAEARARKLKAKKIAKKSANKPAVTKATERVERTHESIEKQIETGKLKKEQIEKIIAETEDLLRMLKKALKSL